MGKTAHTVAIFLLGSTVLLTAAAIGVRGFTYYILPLKERPFHLLHDQLKPGGFTGHGLGVVGTLLISTGVLLYSGRKRIRRFAQLGRVKYFLEFHIFLCSLGPVLVLYHTSFKIGGLVAVAFWSMMAVAASGLIGRYFYVQVPRGIQGHELSVSELQEEHTQLGQRLMEGNLLSDADLILIDRLATPPRQPSRMSLGETLRFFIANDLTRRRRVHQLFIHFARRGVPAAAVRHLRTTANRRIVMARRIAFLEQVHRVFHYWHVIHLPFSIIMFLILGVHIGVAITFGYVWPW